ncbi:GNAT family N-acetyltransferase [Hymenobacter terrenus]|uniref:GNAT family N-acetyltransferase n=1 Tax=Hymenobacter terrenus TaxID=1629124 RepID=UPI0006190996|nr:GNAT family N-acetyltransferase [Hymenobacter terrenus]
MNVAISVLSGGEAHRLVPQLSALLQDAVDSGASIGFLPPLALAEAKQYWMSVAEEVDAGRRTLLIAQRHTEDAILGTVQLDLATKPNALHRAEVAKMLVHTQARRQGIARQLMLAMEEKARELGRTTLVLDTRHGDTAEPLYQSLQFNLVGLIPAYVKNVAGQLEATAVYYKLLSPAGEVHG